MKGGWGPKIRQGSWPERGTSSWAPTTRRSSCGSWRTCAGTPPSSGSSSGARTSTPPPPRRSSTWAPMFVTSDMRRQAKAVNFGILYGMGPFGLARELGVPQKDAKAFIERYFARFPKVKAYLDGVQAQALETEEVTTLLGRRRRFPGIARAAKPLQAGAPEAGREHPRAGLRGGPHQEGHGGRGARPAPEMPPRPPGPRRAHRGGARGRGPRRPGACSSTPWRPPWPSAVPLAVSLSTGKRWDELK